MKNKKKSFGNKKKGHMEQKLRRELKTVNTTLSKSKNVSGLSQGNGKAL